VMLSLAVAGCAGVTIGPPAPDHRGGGHN
jgi:hypothetical protein